MNLRAIVNAVTMTINPNLPATLLRSIGYEQDYTFRQVPKYADPEAICAQVQDLTQKDVQHLERLNLTTNQSVIYVNTLLNSPSRPDGTGGDMISFGPDPSIPAALQNTSWFVTAILESWSVGGWCKASIIRQMAEQDTWS